MDLIDRNSAQALNLKRFYDGQPCIRGHLAQRYTCNGACVECMNRKTSRKSASPVHLLPERALFFGNCEGAQVTQQEATAAYRYIELYAWHETAIRALRADPALLARLSVPREEFNILLGHANRARIEASRK